MYFDKIIERNVRYRCYKIIKIVIIKIISSYEEQSVDWSSFIFIEKIYILNREGIDKR